jgi:hypothetical protein
VRRPPSTSYLSIRVLAWVDGGVKLLEDLGREENARGSEADVGMAGRRKRDGGRRRRDSRGCCLVMRPSMMLGVGVNGCSCGRGGRREMRELVLRASKEADKGSGEEEITAREWIHCQV